MNDAFPAQPPQQPPAKPQATPAQTLLGCLIIIAFIAVIGFIVWFVFLQSSGSPTTTSTRTAAPAAVTAFSDIVLTGAGDSIKQISIPETSAALAVATHSGSGNFIVHSLAADGSVNDLLVNTIGSYAGTVMGRG